MNRLHDPRPGEVDPTRELYDQHNANEQMHRDDWKTEPTRPERPDDLLRPEDIDTRQDLVLTGRKRSGKTRLAKQLPHEPLGFSDPMERICEKVLGSRDKEVADVRKFLRNVGALGRAERLPCELRNPVDWIALDRRMRRDGARITGIGSAETWEQFGRTEDFWIDVMEERVERHEAHPVAIHNARFPEEVRRFTEEWGFEHLHLLSSEETRQARLRESGEDPDPYCKTERLAGELDEVAELGLDHLPHLEGTLCSQLPTELLEAVGRGESVVWSDERTDPIRRPSGSPYSEEADATTDEPDPNGQGVDVAELVHSDIEARVEAGADEYGERLQTENGRDALVDAYQEAIDLALYLRQELAETAPPNS